MLPHANVPWHLITLSLLNMVKFMWWLDSSFSKCQQFSISYNVHKSWVRFFPPYSSSSLQQRGAQCCQIQCCSCLVLSCAGRMPCCTAHTKYYGRSMLGNKWLLTYHICFSFRQQLPRSWQFWLPAWESWWHVYEWLHAWATAVTSPRHAKQHGSSWQTPQSPHAGICK